MKSYLRVDALHELQIQVSPLMRILLAGLSEFGIRLGSEPNDHVDYEREFVNSAFISSHVRP